MDNTTTEFEEIEKVIKTFFSISDLITILRDSNPASWTPNSIISLYDTLNEFVDLVVFTRINSVITVRGDLNNYVTSDQHGSTMDNPGGLITFKIRSEHLPVTTQELKVLRGFQENLILLKRLLLTSEKFIINDPGEDEGMFHEEWVLELAKASQARAQDIADKKRIEKNVRSYMSVKSWRQRKRKKRSRKAINR